MIIQHTAMLGDFTKFSMEGDNDLLEIKERIMFKTSKPTLNDKTTSKELFLFSWLTIGQSYSNTDNIILTNIIFVTYYVIWKCIQWYTNIPHFSIQ